MIIFISYCSKFESLIDHEDIIFFTPCELFLLFCKVPDINNNGLEENVCYEEPYNSETLIDKIFFDLIKKWDKKKKHSTL